MKWNDARVQWICLSVLGLFALLLSTTSAAQDLGTGELAVSGARLVVSPESQTVPFDTPTVVETSLAGFDPASGVLPPGLRVLADLIGPEIDGVLTLETTPGQPFRIPRLRLEGTYQLDHIRLVEDGRLLAYAEPRSAAVTVTQVLVTRVVSRPLTLDEIRGYGIVLDEESFQAFELAFGFGVEGGETYEVHLPVVYDRVTGEASLLVESAARGGEGGTASPRFSPPQLSPFSLEVGAPLSGAIPSGGCDDLFGACAERQPLVLPGAVLFPTDVGLLHQFFSVILMVQNGAPEGDPLVLRDLTARLSLPSSLRAAETEPPTPLGVPIPVRLPGPDGELGTADDLSFLVAQATGEAEALVEGLAEGTHLVRFDLAGVLEGMPEGPRPVSGVARGAVLVRDPSLGVTVSHPDVVRAGEKYPLRLTLTNTGNQPANLITLNVPSGGLAGAELVGSGQETIPSLLPGESGVAEFRLRALLTGRVTAAAARTGSAATPAFELTAGVGEGGIPLSPTSIVLPPVAERLPADLLEEALGLAGAGLSLASAPPTLLGEGLPRVSRQAVDDRLYQLVQAGRHIALGEDDFDAVAVLAAEWLGSRDGDAEWDELRRTTEAARRFAATIGGVIDQEAVTTSPESALDRLAATTAHLPTLQMALAVGAEASLELVSAQGLRRLTHSGTALREIPFAELLALGGGELALLAAPDTAGYEARLRVDGGGSADLHLLVPDVSGALRKLSWENVSLGASGVARVTFSESAGAALLEIDSDGDGLVDSTAAATETTLAPRPFEVVAAVQNERSDPSGHVVEVLLSQDVDLSALLPRDPARFALPGKVSNGGITAGEAALVADLDPLGGMRGSRVVRVVFDNPLSPYTAQDLAVSDLHSVSGESITTAVEPVTITVDTPGGLVEGQVFGADGQGVPFARVELYERDPAVRSGGGCRLHKTAAVQADGAGRFLFDYVRQTDCGGLFELRAKDPTTGDEVTARSRIRVEGETVQMDLRMLGRGTVRGRFLYDDGSAPDRPHLVAHSPVFGEGRVARVDAAGNYEVRGVPVGTVTLAGTDGAGNFVFSTVEMPVAGAVVDRDLVLLRTTPAFESGDVRGHVFGADGVTPEASAYVALYLDDKLVGVERTDQAGAFDFGTVPVGVAEIEAFDAETRRFGAQVFFDVAADRVNEVDLILSDARGSLEGHILRRALDGSASPVVGAVVWAAGTPFHTVTDETGFYRIDEIYAGNWTLHAADLGRREEVQGLVTVSDGATVQKDLYFVDGITGGITGEFLGAGGLPIAGATVHLAAGNLHWFHEVYTDGAGRFSIPGLGPGTYEVHAFRGADGAKAEAVIAFAGDSPFVRLQVAKGTIQGVVKADDGSGQLVGVPSLLSYRTTVVRLGLVALDLGERTLQTEDDGTFVLPDVLAGSYVITAINPFHGEVTVRGAITQHGETVSEELIFETPGEIRGVVLAPDGVTPVAGAEVRLRHPAFSDYRVTSDEEGRFLFGLVPPSTGSFPVDAEIQDGLAFRAARIWAQLPRWGQELELTVVLPEQGVVFGRVEDGSGAAVPGAVVTAAEHAWPHRRLSANADSDGAFRFSNLFAGKVTVSAQAPSLGGLGGQTVVTLAGEGQEAEAVVQLADTGEIEGRILSPVDGSPVPGAEVRLWTSLLVERVTSQADGSFRFRTLPLDTYELTAFDPTTGRRGRVEDLVLTSHGEVLASDLVLEARGEVAGHLSDPTSGSAVPGATLELESLGQVIFRTYSSTDAAGDYEFLGIPEGGFRLVGREPQGRRKARGEGEITAEGERVIVDLALEQTGRVQGTVLDPDGSGAFPNANPRIEQDGRVIGATLTNPFDFQGVLAERTFRLVAEEVGGSHRGEIFGQLGSEGETLTLDFRMQPRAPVTVTVADSLGNPVANAQVNAVSNGYYGYKPYSGTAGGDGTVTFGDVGGGPLTVWATDPVSGLRGSASAELTVDSTPLAVTVALEDSGQVTGRALLSDGVTPAADAVASLTRGQRQLTVVAGADGSFDFPAVPLGSWVLVIQQADGPGRRLVRGDLGASGEVDALGDLILDDHLPAVLAVSPADGSAHAPVAGAVTVQFSEPLDVSRFSPQPNLTSNWVELRKSGGQRVATSYAWSNGNASLTLTPDQPLASHTLYEVRINDLVEDLAGRLIAGRVTTSFTTADILPPTVIDVQPAEGAVEVPVDTAITVLLSEAVQPASVNGASLQLTDLTAGAGVSTTFMLLPGEREIVVQPAADLLPDREYELRVQVLVDGSGNTMSAPFVSRFFTPDVSAPQFGSTAPAQGTSFTSGDLVPIAVEVSDNRAVTAVRLEMGERSLDLTAPPFAWTIPAPAVSTAGPMTITARAWDAAGNEAVATWTIHVQPLADSVAPTITPLCATDGALAPLSVALPVEVAAADDLGLEKVRFYLGASTEPLATVYEAPFTYDFLPPAGTVDGEALALRAVAHDFGGNTTEVQIPLTAVDGFVTPNGFVLTAGDLSYEGETLIVTEGTQVIDGVHALRDLVILGGVVTQSQTGSSGVEERLELTLSRSLYVACGARLDVSAKGYRGGNDGARAWAYPNTQAEGAGPGAGGSHGGQGGHYDGTAPVYGSLFDPREPGGGGGSVGGIGGSPRGGGVVRIAATGPAVIDGALRADGGLISTGAPRGGAAGGSIRLDAASISGSGEITADGSGWDQATRPGGGGGRIALYAGVIDGALVGRTHAAGGESFDAAGRGAAGTVFVKEAAQAHGDLILDNLGLDAEAVTEILPVGSGTVESVTATSFTDSLADLRHHLFGAQVYFAGDDSLLWPVADHVHHGQSLTLDVSGAALTAQAGDAYAGLYRFDRVIVRGLARGLAEDRVDSVQPAEVEPGSAWTPQFTPTLTLTSPVAGTTVPSGASVTLAATVDDARGVASVRFQLGTESFVDTDAPYSWTTVAPTVTVTTSVTVEAEATPLTGSAYRETSQITVVVSNDPVPPTLSVRDCPTDGDVFVPGSAVAFDLTATDDQALERYSLFVDGVLADEVSGVGAPQIEDVLIWDSPTSLPPGGFHTARVEVQDAGFNVVSQTFQLVAASGVVLVGDQNLGVALAGSDVVLGAGTFSLSGELALASLVLTEGATLTTPDAMDLATTGPLSVQCGAAIDVTAGGFPGGATVDAPGQAPAGLGGSAIDAGGSHGGFGLTWQKTGPAGDLFGSVYVPHQGGGGGSVQDIYSGRLGGAGGGVLRLAATTLEVDGEIRSRGEMRRHDGWGEASGAGGSIEIVAGTLAGSGLIDASGGDYRRSLSYAGPGGGGRVALDVGTLSGFDPAAQVRAWGGSRLWHHGGISGYAGPGTVLVKLAGDLYGELLVDNGSEADGSPRSGPDPELPALGTGSVISLTDQGLDAWLEGAAAFRARWLGAWARIEDASGNALGTFRVIELGADGRLLLEGAAGLAGPAAYRGEYRFDRLTLAHGAGLTASDPVVVSGAVVIDGATSIPDQLVAQDLTLTSGTVITAPPSGIVDLAVSGTLTLEAGSAIEVSGAGYAGGVGSLQPGQAPAGLAASDADAGGSHLGQGSLWMLSGPAGDAYGSVYAPWLAGGGGSNYYSGSYQGGAGGGVVRLSAGTLVLDGDIRAVGETRKAFAQGRGEASGAGGAVLLEVTTLSGAGTIDASGGDFFSKYKRAGSGGGGVVAIYADQLQDFDPATQVTVKGGARVTDSNVTDGYAGTGAVFLRTAGMTHGELLLDQRDSHGLTPPVTELPAIGTGTVGLVEADAATAGAAWIEPQDPNALFDLGVVGAWVRIGGNDYRVLAQTADRRRLLLDGADGAVSVGATYAGVYKFDRLILRGRARLRIPDLSEIGAFDIEAGSEWVQ